MNEHVQNWQNDGVLVKDGAFFARLLTTAPSERRVRTADPRVQNLRRAVSSPTASDQGLTVLALCSGPLTFLNRAFGPTFMPPVFEMRAALTTLLPLPHRRYPLVTCKAKDFKVST